MQAHSFGNWLKTRRKARDLTQSELADQVGCSAAAIRKLEAEERRPSAQIVERLAEIFEIPHNEQANFLRFARGEMRSAPVEIKEDLPWQASTAPIRSNLPATVTSLIGREQEIADVRNYLSKGDIRLVTLIGPPGIGKTRLSIEVARALLSDFPDGVFFVVLALLDDPSLIPQTVAQALNFVETNRQSAVEQLSDGIRDKQMLLVLDNCEHLIEGVAALVSFLLSTCPRLKMLTTSRESLRIPGEWVYKVPAFDLSAEHSSVDVESASRHPALILFAERARAVRADFSLTSENIETVTAICARLDGLPLVIELMAARMRFMSPQELLDLLTGQFVLTADGMRAASERQKTLQHAIDWSHGLLSHEEQNMFAYLSIFSGGFTLDAAEAVFSPLFTSKPVSQLITSLLDKSLLQYGSATHSDSTSSRYTMLVTIQEFARNRLQQMSAAAEIHNRHSSYFLALAEQADRQIHGPQQLDWINRLEAEHDNFRAAFEWSLSTNNTENAVQFFNLLNWAWHIRGHFSEMAEWFEKIIHLPDLDHFPLLRATAMINAARWEWWKGQGKLTKAHSHLEQSRTICEELGREGEAQLAWALTWLSHILRMEGTELGKSASFARDALQLHQRLENQIGEAFSTLLLGVTEVHQGLLSAKPTLLHSLELFRQLGDSWGMARASQFLGLQSLQDGDFEQAGTYFEQHRLLDQKLDFRPGLMAALDNLGELYRIQGDLTRARQTLQESIQISQEYGLTPSYSIYSLSVTALAKNDYESARNYSIEYFHHERSQFSDMVACDFFMLQAAVAGGVGQAERSAKLYGAAQLILDTTEYKYLPSHIDEFERHIQLAREQLAENFEAFVKEGRAMTMEQAVAYALEDQE